MKAIFRFVMSRRIPILRRWLPALAKGWAALTWKGGFNIAYVHNAYFIVDYRGLVDRHIGLFGGWEDQHFRFVSEKIDEHSCDLFIDIGANLGYYTVLMARNAKVRNVIAFEPDMRNFHHMCGNLYLNRLSAEVTAHSLAVSNINGPLRFLLREEAASAGSRAAHAGDRDTVEVQAVRLDDFLQISGQALFFKVDVEGHELEALEGMTRLLEQNRCFLQVESFERNAAQTIDFFESIGYRLCNRFGPDHFFENFSD